MHWQVLKQGLQIQKTREVSERSEVTLWVKRGVRLQFRSTKVHLDIFTPTILTPTLCTEVQGSHTANKGIGIHILKV